LENAETVAREPRVPRSSLRCELLFNLSFLAAAALLLGLTLPVHAAIYGLESSQYSLSAQSRAADRKIDTLTRKQERLDESLSGKNEELAALNTEIAELESQIEDFAYDDEDDYDAALRLKEEAQTYLARAYRRNDADYATLLLIAENRAGTPGYPNDNDLAVLEQAFVLAPQLASARLNLAQLLIHRDRAEEAVVLLEPLVNDPHGGSAYARALLLRAKGLTEEEAAAQEAALAGQVEAEGEADADDDPAGGR